MQRRFARNSFDRFGDDLTELIAGFLTFDDKFRFECLSKQWQTYVFNKQKRLTIDTRFQYKSSPRVVITRLDSVLKKCRNISVIDVFIEPNNIDKVFETIINRCRYLTEIRADFCQLSEDIIQLFCQKFVSKLKTIDFKRTDDKSVGKLKRVVELCPQSTTYLSHYLNHSSGYVFSTDDNNSLFNNLKSFRFEFRTDDNRCVEKFISRNKESLESLSVIVSAETSAESDFVFLFDQLIRVKNLRKISIAFSSKYNIKVLVKFLKQLSTTHSRLTHLSLRLALDDRDQWLRVYNLMNLFRSLTALELVNHIPRLCSVPSIAVQYFPKYCNNVIHLKIGGNCLRMDDEFVASIGERLPRLQSLSLNGFKELKEHCFQTMSGLPDLRSLDLAFKKYCINDKTVVEFTRVCRKLVSIRMRLNAMTCDLNERDITRIRAKTNRFKLKWVNAKDCFTYNQTFEAFTDFYF